MLPPDETHSALIDAVHGAMQHPSFDAEHKSDLAKVLGVLTARQAKMHSQARPQAGPGGPTAETSPEPQPVSPLAAILQHLQGAGQFPSMPGLHMQPNPLVQALQAGPVTEQGPGAPPFSSLFGMAQGPRPTTGPGGAVY